MLHIIKEALRRGLVFGELPPNINVPMPLESECYRIPTELSLQRKSRVHIAAEARSKKGLETGQPRILPPPTAPAGVDIHGVPVTLPPELQTDTTPFLAAGAGLSLQTGKEGEGEGEGALTPVFDNNLYRELCRRVKMKNAELHSLRCDIQLKIWVAEKFEEDCIYFPHNLDFRGRAYPVPQNLSHVGSDVCRGLLTFDEAKPLGPVGFDWLKVHLANLFGHNKITLRQRVNWVDEHMDQVIDSAKQPLDGLRWWTTAEEPFQALAAILEIVAAHESGDPANYRCNLPIHQDGSCNGLQHYAALGRDESGGIAVNLMPNREPQDVYSTVLDIVMAKIAVDVKIPPDAENKASREKGQCARLVHGIVNRKVVKQTVMTSVYGVTRVGARAQVQARLEERLQDDRSAISSPEAEKEIFEASRWVCCCLAFPPCTFPSHSPPTHTHIHTPPLLLLPHHRTADMWRT